MQWASGVLGRYPNWRTSGSKSFNATATGVVGDVHVLYYMIEEKVPCSHAFRGLSVTFVCQVCGPGSDERYPREVQLAEECEEGEWVGTRLASFAVYTDTDGAADAPGVYVVESALPLWETTTGTQGLGSGLSLLLLTIVGLSCFCCAGSCCLISCFAYGVCPEIVESWPPEHLAQDTRQAQEEDSALAELLAPGQSFPAPGQSFPAATGQSFPAPSDDSMLADAIERGRHLHQSQVVGLVPGQSFPALPQLAS